MKGKAYIYPGLANNLEISEDQAQRIFDPITNAERLLEVAKQARRNEIVAFQGKILDLVNKNQVPWAHPLLFPWVANKLEALAHVDPVNYVERLKVAGQLLRDIESPGNYVILAFPYKEIGPHFLGIMKENTYYCVVVGISNMGTSDGTIKATDTTVEIPFPHFVMYNTATCDPNLLHDNFFVKGEDFGLFWRAVAGETENAAKIFVGTEEECKTFLLSTDAINPTISAEEFDADFAATLRNANTKSDSFEVTGSLAGGIHV